MFLKIISIIGSLTFLSRILGYIRDLLIAISLGASFVSDAFFVAFKLPNLFRRLFAEGAMNSAFVPVVSEVRIEKGIRESNLFLSEIISITFSFLLPFIIILEIFMPTVINLVAPGFIENKEKFHLTIDLTRLTFPFLLFVCLTSLIGGYLNTLSKFAAMAFTPVILNLSMLSVLLVCIIEAPAQKVTAQMLSASISIAGIIQLIWLFFNLKRNNIDINFRRFFLISNFKISTNAKKLLSLFIPAALGSGVYQLNLLIDMILASTLPDGSISYLYFADRVNQLPLGVLGIALSTALLPILSKQIKSDQKESNYTINHSIQVGIIFSLPAASGLLVLSEIIINVLFVRGQFTLQDGLLTSRALQAFSIGLPAFIFVKIFAVIFFARQDTKTPVYVAFFAMLLNLALNIVLIKEFFHVGLALATSIASWFSLLVLFYITKKKGFFIIDRKTISVFFKCFISSIIMSIFIKYLHNTDFLNINNFNSIVNNIFTLSALIIFGTIFYLILLYFFKIFYLLKFKTGEKN